MESSMMTSILAASQLLLWIAFFAMALAMLAVARQVGILFERVAPAGALMSGHGPDVGRPAPQLNLPTLTGEMIAVGKPARSGKMQLLVFISAQCPICRTLIPVAKSVAGTENLELLFAGDAEASEQLRLVDAYGIQGIPFLNSAELGRAFAVDKLPHAVLIDANGVIASKGLVNSREHLESLIIAHDLKIPSVQDYLGQERA